MYTTSSANLSNFSTSSITEEIKTFFGEEEGKRVIDTIWKICLSKTNGDITGELIYNYKVVLKNVLCELYAQELESESSVYNLVIDYVYSK